MNVRGVIEVGDRGPQPSPGDRPHGEMHRHARVADILGAAQPLETAIRRAFRFHSLKRWPQAPLGEVCYGGKAINKDQGWQFVF